MKRYIQVFATMALCAGSFLAGAQTMSKSVVASAGGSYTGSGIMVDWTAGQAIAKSSSTSGYTVTEGFHPIAEEAVVGVPPVKSNTAPLVVKAFPNPVNDQLHINIQQPSAEPLTLTVSDLSGKVLASTSLQASASTETEMDLSAYASGIYYIIVNHGKENVQVMKILKN